MKYDLSIVMSRLRMFVEIILRPFVEVFLGIKGKQFPFFYMMILAALISVLLVLRVDFYAWQVSGIAKYYPFQPKLYWSYYTALVVLPVWLWGFFSFARKMKKRRELDNIFTNSRLQNGLGDNPRFVSDRPIDEYSRILTVDGVGIPLKEFKNKEKEIATSLRVYIDEVREIRAKGLVEIIYSSLPMPKNTKVGELSDLRPLEFIVGDTRTKRITANLRDCPHVLIGGQTGGGKSTALRQMITSLYINSKASKFLLLDFKDELEFMLFKDLPRVDIVSTWVKASLRLSEVERTMTKRAKFLKANGCNDVHSFFKLKKDLRKRPLTEIGSLNPFIVVIDEAAEAMLVTSKENASNVQSIRAKVSRISRIGRALGVHLIIATQRPTVNAVDGQTKTNMTGRLSFPMADNQASMAIVDTGRAAKLPSIPGRAIWKEGMVLKEVQVPELSTERARAILSSFKNTEKVSPQSDENSLPEVGENEYEKPKKAGEEFDAEGSV